MVKERQSSGSSLEDIGLCAGAIAMRANVNLRSEIEINGIPQVRFIVAFHCLVFSELMSFTRERRPDLEIQIAGKDFLHGISKLAATCDGTSSYRELIVDPLEQRLFRSYLIESFKNESLAEGLLDKRHSVVELFRGIVFFRENLFRSSQMGDEAGLSRKLTVSFVTCSEKWLLPKSIAEHTRIALLEKLHEANTSAGYIFELFNRILQIPVGRGSILSSLGNEDDVRSIEISSARGSDSTAIAQKAELLSQNVYDRLAGSVAYQEIRRVFSEAPQLVEKIQILSFVAAHMRLVCEIKYHYQELASPMLYQAVAECTQRILVKNKLPQIDLEVAIPNEESRQRLSSTVLKQSGHCLPRSIGPDLVFGLRLIDDMPRFVATFVPREIGSMSRDSIAIGSAAILGYLVAIAQPYKAPDEPSVEALGNLAITITETVIFALGTMRNSDRAAW